MRSILKYALWGAILGFIAVTVFAVGEMLGDANREAVPFPVTLILAMAMGGLLFGAPGGAVLGGLVGAVLSRRPGGAPSTVGGSTAAPPLPAPSTAAPEDSAPSPPKPAPWIGAPGEPLETRATVLSVGPYTDPFAERAVRHLHWLRTPQGQVIRWLANESRGLSAGQKIVLRGTVKEHTWDANAAPITEVWYCQTRPAPQERASQPAPSGATRAPTQPAPTPERKAEPEPQSSTPPQAPRTERPEVNRDAVIEASNVVRRRMAEENERRKPQLLAPVKPAPNPVTRSGVDLRDPERLNKVLDGGVSHFLVT